MEGESISEVQINSLPFKKIESSNLSEFEDIFKTSEFNDWFKGSKLKGQDGKPLLFFTGGGIDIKKFNRDNPQHTGLAHQGYYFSPDKKDALFYASIYASNQGEEGKEPNGSVYTVCLKTENPLIIGKKSKINPFSIDQWPEGYDCIFNKIGMNISEVVVKDPSQIWILKEETLLHNSKNSNLL
jgi:hypothetical protein